MANDEAIRELTQQIGELTGCVRQYIRNQDAINMQHADKIEKNGDAIDELQSDHTRFKGIAIGMGVGGTGFGAAIMKLLSMVGIGGGT